MSKIFDSIKVGEKVKKEVDKSFEGRSDAFYGEIEYRNYWGKNGGFNTLSQTLKENIK